ncbi:hypothetical protein BCV70DRAFT_202263 [Testicularia cyperi]|uniref:PAN2-PAN3 deadenylation complex catalytic subunit PAN2 n=1 Tax=Testicularia cyperi TaxID=1882483 RepID=A0A317XKY0_9BASI|nr:hypothetical protein BCV70DRAFT_202263 [Testicularia cyperi]
MADWSEQAQYGNLTGPLGLPPAVTSLAFDPYSELLWQATSYGSVSSLYSSQLSRYTSYAAHGTPTRPSPTKGLLIDERHIYSIGDNSIKCSTRRGLAKWSTLTKDLGLTSMSLVSMCASPLAASSDIVAGGVSQSATSTGELDAENDLLLAVNNSTGAVVRHVPSEAPLLHVRKSGRLVCAATINGHIQLRDPRTLRIEHRLHAHPGGLIDMQADGNTVYSVGWTVRQGHPVPEPLVKVHDLRTMRALVPIPFAAPGGPALLAIHPKVSSTVVVSAPSGQFQIVDIANPGEARLFYTSATSYVTSLAIAPSADYIAFGEADGTVRLWSASSDTSNLRFNSYSSAPLEFPDPIEPPPYVNWSTETPLSSIGMPHYTDKLLSHFEYEQYFSEASPLFNPPNKLDPAVLNSLKTVDYLGYATLPPHLRGKRNVVAGKGPGGVRASALHRPEDRKKIGIPLFRSEKEKELNKKAAAAAAAGIVPGDKKKKKAEKKEAEKKRAAAERRSSPVDSDGKSAHAASTDRADSTEAAATRRKGSEGDSVQRSASDVSDASDDDSTSGDSDDSDEEEAQEDLETAETMLAKGQMPSYYRLKTIQYSRFGVEDFDFDFYNKTPFSGLETHIQNSYANSYLQALHYLPPFRETAKAHILQNCPRENCLLCEAGFLFRMLEDAKGANCQATNFLRAFGNSHKAASLGLMDREDGPTNAAISGAGPGNSEIVYSNLVQTLNRFMLECTASEAQALNGGTHAIGAAPASKGMTTGAPPGLGPPLPSNGSRVGRLPSSPTSPTSPTIGIGGGASGGSGGNAAAWQGFDALASTSHASVARLFSLQATTKSVCIHCGRDSSRSSPTLSVDLIYPRRPMSNEPAPPSDFASVLRASLLREAQNRAPCRACQFTAMFRSRRVMPPTSDLPRVLSVNAAIHTPEHLHFWLDANQKKDTHTAQRGPGNLHQQQYGAGPNSPGGNNMRGSGYLPPHPHQQQQQQARTGTPTSGLDSKPPGAAKRTYLPPRIAVETRGDDVRVLPVYTAVDLEQAKLALGGAPAVYKLRSMVVQISAEKEQPHLCALVRVPEAESVPSSFAGVGATTAAGDGKNAAAPMQIFDTKDGKDHRGRKVARAKASALGPWYLFNDFLVRNTPESEALGFQNTWKIPSVLMWEREDMAPLSMLELSEGRTCIDPTILCQDFNVSWNRDPKRIRHELLSHDELPRPGMLVAIDAEFVALNQEELEIRSDGTRSVIRPTRLSLARVSVVRGQGSKQGEAFIDDHIHTQEEVVDYLTKFSGILPGDLDPKVSKHTVVPLKAAYKKLRLLVDSGCIFIGHGLKKDFRIINIYVPASQVIDTVDLYHSPNHPRRLSLRFLSWFLLKIDIQSGSQANNQITAREREREREVEQQHDSDARTDSLSVPASASGQTSARSRAEVSQVAAGAGSTAVEGGHDSIEDALAALRLFRLYQAFRKDNRLDDVLDDVYEVGRRVNWKPPNST